MGICPSAEGPAPVLPLLGRLVWVSTSGMWTERSRSISMRENDVRWWLLT